MERLTYRDVNGEAWYSDAGTEADRLHFIANIEDILGDEYDLDRLRELVQSDRDGRCVVLLSNDDVYTIRGDIVNGIIKANCRDACKPPKSALKGDQHG